MEKQVEYETFSPGLSGERFRRPRFMRQKEERYQWQQWARETGREQDLVIIDASGKWRFNFLDWEASRAGEVEASL